MDYMTDTKKDKRPNPYPIRIPQELRAELAVLAKRHNRSLAMEIVTALEQYVELSRNPADRAE